MSLWNNFKNTVTDVVEVLPGGPVIAAAGGLLGKAGSFAGRQLIKPFEKLAELDAKP
jgi:hypothetical protein